MAEEVNEALDRAFRAWMDKSPGASAAAVEDALRAARRYEFRLAEVVDRVRVGKSRVPEPESFRFVREETTFVGGAPALRVDYEYHDPSRVYFGRDYYFVQGRSLFVASFWGLKRNLELFDRIVASVTFPAAAPDETPRP